MGGKPCIGITMGDPCGIGPEVIAKSLGHSALWEWCHPIVIGSSTLLQKELSANDIHLKVSSFAPNEDFLQRTDSINVIDLENIDLNLIKPGELSPRAGHAAMEWVRFTAELCLSNKIPGMATAPINKEATMLAGYKDIGHMEVLQRLSSSPDVATMLIADNLRVVHLTTHKSLKQACEFVTKENILRSLRLTDSSFRKWGYGKVRIGVAALNPHGSDGGLIGDEEATEIAPSIQMAVDLGIDARGPIPADIIFYQAITGHFDVVLALYHDQGHIPIKIHNFERSISVNLGLPFVRTSVDHGTAFDIAGAGIANPVSMLEAIRVAASLASTGELEKVF